jgi:hypothetical protein
MRGPSFNSDAPTLTRSSRIASDHGSRAPAALVRRARSRSFERTSPRPRRRILTTTSSPSGELAASPLRARRDRAPRRRPGRFRKFAPRFLRPQRGVATSFSMRSLQMRGTVYHELRTRARGGAALPAAILALVCVASRVEKLIAGAFAATPLARATVRHLMAGDRMRGGDSNADG